MPEQTPIEKQIESLKPNYGAGQTGICQRCMEHLKHDVDHLIAEELEKMCIPSEVINGVNPWEHLHELLKIRRGQRGD